MLSATERDLVLHLLTAELAVQDSPRAWLDGVFGDRDLVTRVRFRHEPASLAAEVLEACLRDSWAHQPPWIKRLLQAFSHLDGIPPLLSRFAVAPPQPPDPYLTCRLMNGLPFLDRSRLRTGLRALNGEIPHWQRCVWVVNGPQGCGKTYTRELIAFLSEAGKTFHVAYAQRPQDSAARYEAEDLSRELLDSALVSYDPWAPAAQPEDRNRWIKELCAWTLKELASGGECWWIVADGFSDPRRWESAMKLIGEIANQLAANLNYRRRFRLVLLDFPEQLLTGVRGWADFESLSPAAIGRPEIEEYFHALFQEEPDSDRRQGLVDAAVDRVIADWGGPGNHLAALNEVIDDVTRVALGQRA